MDLLDVTIQDDLDLEKIMRSGQCFRMSHAKDGAYLIIATDKALLIRHCDENKFQVSCTKIEWNTFWSNYFDLNRSYSSIRQKSLGKSNFVDTTINFGEGLRILNQDPWEMLITFIISQRKSMPAIATCVEAISKHFGKRLNLDPLANWIDPHLELHAFPAPTELVDATDEELRTCGLGYRSPYISDAARLVHSGEIDLDSLKKLSDEELIDALQRIKGVGIKVANCVSLFGYGRRSSVPVDVWIARAIDEKCAGESPFEMFGEDAGVIQQYIFYYMTQNK